MVYGDCVLCLLSGSPVAQPGLRCSVKKQAYLVSYCPGQAFLGTFEQNKNPSVTFERNKMVEEVITNAWFSFIHFLKLWCLLVIVSQELRQDADEMCVRLFWHVDSGWNLDSLC